MNKPPAPAPKPKHRLLAQARQWHRWGGLVAGLFLLLVGASGIVLNYKQPIFAALGLERSPTKPERSRPSTEAAKLEFSTGGGLAALPVSLERALEIVRAEWGEVPLERIELKAERGAALYKFKQKAGSELCVNAATGAYFTKGEYERVGKAGADGVPVRATDWGKILIDLHTGKIGGEVGKAIMSLAALLLLLLTLSGVYMWLKPLLIRRQNASAKPRAIPPAPLAIPTGAPTRARERELAEA
jgi:uncharacterized iron-regulated membrane protein